MLLWTVLALMPLTSPAQDSCEPIAALKEKVYTFRPSAISAAERTAKSKEMDAFWNLVQSRKTDGAACLRQLLASEKTDSFFLYDGASLLASLDRSESSMPVIVDSVARAPLADVDAGAYVNLAIALGRENADITRLAVRFLEHPDDKISAPAHALTLDRMFGALLLFGSLPIDRADAALIEALDHSQSRVREAAAMLLAALMTEGGLRALSQSPRVAGMSASTRAQVDQARTAGGYKQPPGSPAFTRQQVLEHLQLLPRTSADYAAALEREDKYRSQLPKAASIDAELRQLTEGPPFTSLAGHRRFIESAAETLTAEDLPALRQWRRQSVRSLSDETLGDFMAFSVIVHSVIDRLGLYGEYRIRKDGR